MPIQKNEQTTIILEKQGLNYKSVIPENEIIFLRHSSNLTQGGENIEISNLVSDHLKETAVKSVSANPGLKCADVDLLYTS